MKHWEKGKTELGYGEEGIILKCQINKYDADKLISVRKSECGFVITEECDGHYSAEFTKEGMLEIIEELKEWIES